MMDLITLVTACSLAADPKVDACARLAAFGRGTVVHPGEGRSQSPRLRKRVASGRRNPCETANRQHRARRLGGVAR